MTGMVNHLRRWGAPWVLAALFLGSWIAQLVAQLPEVHEEGWSRFWASTFENWQSEFLSNLVLALLIDVGAVVLFRKITAKDEARGEQLDRIEAKLDEASRRGIV